MNNANNQNSTKTESTNIKVSANSVRIKVGNGNHKINIISNNAFVEIGEGNNKLIVNNERII